jgi:hypothetical protein
MGQADQVLSMVMVLISLKITDLRTGPGFGYSLVSDLLDKGALVTQWVAQGRIQLTFIL